MLAEAINEEFCKIFKITSSKRNNRSDYQPVNSFNDSTYEYVQVNNAHTSPLSNSIYNTRSSVNRQSEYYQDDTGNYFDFLIL